MLDSNEANLPFQTEPLPQDEAEVRARHESNRAGWNEGARHYTDHLDQTIQNLRNKKSNLHPVERRNLGDLHQYHTAVHLQCASGGDTLSLWLEGVQQVIGVDISDVHIDNARRISAALDAPAEWHRCDILDTPHELDGVADLVYTGRGAICWMHDLTAWANVITRLLKPGGVFHILDDHPFTWLFNPEARSPEYSGINYFSYAESSQGWPDTYIGDTLGIPVTQQSRKYERLWTLSAIFNSLKEAGLVIEYFGEHPEPYWDNFPNLAPDVRDRIPMTFSILARKPLVGSRKTI